METALLIAILSGVVAAPAPPDQPRSTRPKVSRAAPRDAAKAAPSVRLTMLDGKVWLNADRVTAGEILVAWAKVGQTRIVNGEGLPGGPMVLELNGVPEQQALEVVLRAASGFLAVARTITVADAPPTPSTTSRFARIVVLPASTPPPDPGVRTAVAAPAVAPPVPQFPVPGALAPQRIIGPDGLPVPDDQEDAPGRPPAGSMPPGFSPPPQAPQAPAAQAAPVTPGAILVTPQGVSTPGMIVPLPPVPPVIPVRVRPRPGGPD